MTALILACAGCWIVQDGIASILFYGDKEGRLNHSMRGVRIGIGVAIIVLAVKLIGG